MSDPLNYAIALILALLFLALKALVWPRLKGLWESTAGSKYAYIAMLVSTAIQAAEQARRKGDLNGFADMFGVNIDLADDRAIRNAVVTWVQIELSKHFSWGKKVSISTILVILESLLREDKHKGQVDPLEEVAKAGAAGLLRYAKPEDIQMAAQAITEASVPTPQIPIAQSMPPVTDKRSRRR